MYLDPEKKDKWGIPLIVFDAAFGENEIQMRKDMANSAAEMLDAAGFKNITHTHLKMISMCIRRKKDHSHFTLTIGVIPDA